MLFPLWIVFVKNRQELGKSNITSSRIKPLNYCSSLIVVFTVSVVKNVIKAKGDDAMGSKVKEFISVNLDILYTMSANLAGGALLAKTLQMTIA